MQYSGTAAAEGEGTQSGSGTGDFASGAAVLGGADGVVLDLEPGGDPVAVPVSCPAAALEGAEQLPGDGARPGGGSGSRPRPSFGLFGRGSSVAVGSGATAGALHGHLGAGGAVVAGMPSAWGAPGSEGPSTSAAKPRRMSLQRVSNLIGRIAAAAGGGGVQAAAPLSTGAALAGGTVGVLGQRPGSGSSAGSQGVTGGRRRRASSMDLDTITRSQSAVSGCGAGGAPPLHESSSSVCACNSLLDYRWFCAAS